MNPRDTLEAFDRFLAARGLRLDAVVIGGAALNLLGVIERATKDCDVLYPRITAEQASAARSFAVEVRARGGSLEDDWLNNGPESLTTLLPPGWEHRLQPLFAGAVIELRSLGHDDLLRTKLFALCDRGFDLADCVALAPTAGELHAILSWLEEQDAHPGWPEHVRATIADLGRRLGHGV